MVTDHVVVFIEQQSDHRVYKGYSGFGEARWIVEVNYITEEGLRVPSACYYRLMRDAKKFAATLPCPPQHPTNLELREDGSLRSVTTKFVLGRQS